MKAADLRDKTPDQLRDQLGSLKKEAFNLRFQRATGQLENTSRMQSVRRDAARVKTILRQMEVAAQIKAETGVDLNPAHAEHADAKPKKASPKAKKASAKSAKPAAAKKTTKKAASAKKEAK